MTIPLHARPYPVGLSWRQWRDTLDPDTTRPVLVLHKGTARVVIGPDDADSIISALERMLNEWETQ